MTFKSRILGYIAYYITLLLGLTLRVVIYKHPEYNSKTQYLFAFWHGKQLLPVFELQNHDTRRVALVSPSRDGDILTVWLKNLGYEVIRGSSRKQNIRALAGMIRKLKAGYSLGFGIDGPIGPIYKVKPGMTHMAQKLRIPIIPVGSAFSRSWVFEKAWDKYEIPKPFAKAVFYLGKPCTIEKEADLAISNDMLEGLIMQAEITARTLL
jgi:lysophospholipid acyltransferase (LPLAT)-like uncharacterized protein